MARQTLNMLTGADVPSLEKRGVEVDMLLLEVTLPVAVGIMVTDPVLILTVTPDGPEIVVMSVCAETEVDSVWPKLSVSTPSRPLVTVTTGTEGPLSRVILPPPRIGMTLPDAAEEATPDEAAEPPSRVILPPPRIGMTLPDAAEEATPDEAAEPPSRVILPPPRTGTTMLDAAEEALLVGAGVADGAGDALEGEAAEPAALSVGDEFAAVDKAPLRADERLESAE
ncbi:hypothetical protein E6O75_ATG07236 [Venturia nashicola]|uniref:Uncharacterized protein n=1 Tax=Venturia nashicola TaxID=86259 RepID=A0A4Z1P1A4_9PEZI|nr:hypothetical protein E6O75_ATG07236 [Venturia nashicola]